jgi:SAM-dependent methyltransferase
MVDTALGAGTANATRLRSVGQRGGWLVPERVDAPELLDIGAGTPDEVTGSLNDLWRLNRYLGGLRALTIHLYPRLQALSGTAHCLDLGAGDGRVAATIAGWSRRSSRNVRVTALDLSSRNLDRARPHTAQHTNLALLQADAIDLPFAPGSVDYVVSSLVLHHFAPEQAVALLRSAWRCARRGLVITDLMRGYLPLVGFHLVKYILATSPITHYDGHVSIRRGYTPGELRLLAREAGIPNARVTVHPMWRMSLVADR